MQSEEEEARRPTICGIAELASALPGAVSAVLDGTWRGRRISERPADRIPRVADGPGLSVNAQASLLRRDRSTIIGMIVPKRDNRHFAPIAERFGRVARKRGAVLRSSPAPGASRSGRSRRPSG